MIFKYFFKIFVPRSEGPPLKPPARQSDAFGYECLMEYNLTALYHCQEEYRK